MTEATAFTVEALSSGEISQLPVLDLGSTETVLRGLNDWVAIESPTADMAAVNAMMDKAALDLVAVGLGVERVAGSGGRGDHLVARAPWNDEGHRGILLLGHLDTVHPIGSLVHNPIRSEGGRAFGPGIQDMKSGAFLAKVALERLIAAGQRTPLPVTVLLVSDEEVGSGSSRALIEAHARQSKYALVLEPARSGGKIVTTRKGVGRFELQVTGRPAHAGNAHREGRSAIAELARQILALEAMTDYDRGITLNIGLVAGGTAENVVPERAWASIDVRMPAMADAEALAARIMGMVSTHSDVTLRVTGGINRVPYRKGDRPDIASLFEHAKTLAASLGFVLEDLPDGEGSGGSDGQFCIPYCTVLDGLGPCGAGLHTHGEYIEIESIHPRGMLLLNLMRTLR